MSVTLSRHLSRRPYIAQLRARIAATQAELEALSTPPAGLLALARAADALQACTERELAQRAGCHVLTARAFLFDAVAEGLATCSPDGAYVVSPALLPAVEGTTTD